MDLTAEEMAARLTCEAARREITTEELLDELEGQVLRQSSSPGRFAFGGMGRSGRGDLAERHKRIRDGLIAEQRSDDQ